MKKLVVSLFLAVAASNIAAAEIITFNTSDPSDPSGFGQGWWSDTASNFDGNDNTITGNFGGNDYLGFFTFDLGDLNLMDGDVIVGATFNSYTSTVVGDQTLSFYDVSTDASTLNNNSGSSSLIFDDLGSGNGYGTLELVESDDNGWFSVVLNNFALNDIADSDGGFFSIGSSSSIDSDGYVYGWSHLDDYAHELVLDVQRAVPEPSTWMMMILGFGMVAAGAKRRRRTLVCAKV